MPRYSYDISYILSEAEVKGMYLRAKGKEALLIALLWLTAARPNELLQLRHEDISSTDTELSIKLKTLKLGQGKEFMVKERVLTFERTLGLDAVPYIETVINNARATPSGSLLISRGSRWAEKAINRLSMEVLNKPLSPYHFRHSVLTWLGRKGYSSLDIQYFKGSKTLASVEPYLHAKPFTLRAKDLRRD